MDMYILLYLKWKTSKDLVYSTGNSTVMWQPGWEGSLGGLDTCIGMAESLCYSPEMITILLIGYTPTQNNKFKVKKKKKKGKKERKGVGQ